MGGPSESEPLIFVSDASAEAERLTTALRVRGYVVVDVPLTLVVSRASVQRPSLILCDVDATEAIETMARLRDVPGGSGVDIIFLGEAGGTLDDMPDAVFHEGSGFFVRPVDVYALLRKVEALIGPPKGVVNSMVPGSARGALLPSQLPYGPPSSSGRPARISSAPPRAPSSTPSSRNADSSRGAAKQTGPESSHEARAEPLSEADRAALGAGPAAPTQPPPRSSEPPPEALPTGPGPVTYEPAAPGSGKPSWSPAAPTQARPTEPPNDSPSLPAPVPLGFGVEAEPAGSPLARQIPQSEMSPELERLLARAEQRVGLNPSSSNPPARLSPEEEVEAVLPAEVLAALDEPLDHDAEDDGEESSIYGTRSGSDGGGTGLGTGVGTGGTRAPIPVGTQAPSPSEATRPPSIPAGARTASGGSLFPPSENQAGPASEAPGSLSKDEVTPPAVPTRGSWMPMGPTGVDSQRESVGSFAPAPHSEPPPHTIRPTPLPPSARDAMARRHPPPPGLPAGAATPALAPSAALATPPPVPPSAAMTAPPPVPPSAAMTAPPPYHRNADAELTLSPSDGVPLVPPAAQAPVITSAPDLASIPEIPTALGVGDTVRALARAVRSRYTGALAVEDSAGIRRVVLRDGDLVTAASGIEGESLVAFLAQRGVLTPDVAARLGRKLAQFGRHAGAALIAHGHLRQDELWPVLRAHAEWIVGRVIDVEHGALSLEKELPGRLQAEPAVFGGATGAEVLVEVVRRSVPPGEAIRRMGGRGARFADGPGASLLGECALVEADVALVGRAKSSSIDELLESTHSDDPAPMLYALVELGVLQILSPSDSARREASAPQAPQTDELDEEALRARIEARMALVREGDYFAVLGISRGATGYDIRRAYLDLRREFEPSRILSARTADLRDDVDVICEVLDEAYDVLRDQMRRDRYRRALEATPR